MVNIDHGLISVHVVIIRVIYIMGVGAVGGIRDPLEAANGIRRQTAA